MRRRRFLHTHEIVRFTYIYNANYIYMWVLSFYVCVTWENTSPTTWEVFFPLNINIIRVVCKFPAFLKSTQFDPIKNSKLVMNNPWSSSYECSLSLTNRRPKFKTFEPYLLHWIWFSISHVKLDFRNKRVNSVGHQKS